MKLTFEEWKIMKNEVQQCKSSRLLGGQLLFKDLIEHKAVRGYSTNEKFRSDCPEKLV
jgi:hypothetical protein